MSWAVEAPIRVGPVAFAVISEVEITVHGKGRFTLGTGMKRPALILQCAEDQVRAIDMDGRVHDEQDIERRFPRAADRLRAFVRDGVGRTV